MLGYSGLSLQSYSCSYKFKIGRSCPSGLNLIFSIPSNINIFVCLYAVLSKLTFIKFCFYCGSVLYLSVNAHFLEHLFHSHSHSPLKAAFYKHSSDLLESEQLHRCSYGFYALLKGTSVVITGEKQVLPSHFPSWIESLWCGFSHCCSSVLISDALSWYNNSCMPCCQIFAEEWDRSEMQTLEWNCEFSILNIKYER